MSERLEPSSEGPGRVAALLVQVERARCRLHVVHIYNTRYSDDAGDRHEQLSLDVELDGALGRLSGRYRVFDTSEEPMIDLDEIVTGTATHSTSAPAEH